MDIFANKSFLPVLAGKPQARAIIRGDGAFPEISGLVDFFQIRGGVLVSAEIRGLPKTEQPCGYGIFGFHIHEGENCVRRGRTGFPETGGHFNPENCRHPAHKGDLPPLFSDKGLAAVIFLTDRITINEIVGRTVIIHREPDDFSEPVSGGAGVKMACGEIHRVGR